jgi:hypothetical protein
MRLQAGQTAPAFLRPDISGKMLRPKDYRGRDISDHLPIDIILQQLGAQRAA